MYIKLSILLLSISGILGCSLIETKLNFEIHGAGFHRILKTDVNISSGLRFINCKVSYLFQIPQGAYVDIDNLNSTLYKHCFVSKKFDVEEAHGSPKLTAQLQPIFFQSKHVMRKVFVFSDSLSFPVHLRYHRPSSNTTHSSNEIVFEPPRVYLGCEHNESLLADHSCKRQIEKVPCGCHHKQKCSHLHLNTVLQVPMLKVSVPVGNTNEYLLVVYVTMIVLILGLGMISMAVIQNQPKIE